MLPLLNRTQLQEEDARTIRDLPIASIDLMERASLAFCDALLRDHDINEVRILCGPGNNGGDGLAIARILFQRGCDVEVYVPENPTRFSSDMQVNLQRWTTLGRPTSSLEYFSDPMSGCVIDALFGSGITRPLEGIYAAIIKRLNAMDLPVYSVDLPSGMPVEPTFNWDRGQVVCSSHVYTFQYPKLSLLSPASKGFAEHWTIVDIGLLPYVGEVTYGMLEDPDLRALYRPPSLFDHKYDKGHVTLVGGSKGKEGAILLAAEAAYRSGAGLVSVHAPETISSAMKHRLPEVMLTTVGATDVEELGSLHPKTLAIGIGPGLGLDKWHVVQEVLASRIPTVLDADALHCISQARAFDQLHAACILTPHEGEFKALVGSWKSEMEKFQKAVEFCARNGCILLLKGRYTMLTNGNAVRFNPISHPALGTAGSGDVLTGILTALLAQGLAPWEAAQFGPYLHVKSAQRWLDQRSSATMLASDITISIGQVIQGIQQDIRV